MNVIALDAMGGDNAPFEIVKGAVESLKNNKSDITILLVGIENKIEAELAKYTYDKTRMKVVGASEVIGTDEVPTVAIKNKKDSSIVVGLTLVKEGKAKAFVSAGNTGALLTGATVIVGRIKGIERPALGTLIPNKKGFYFLMDAGANVDCKPSYLVQFAKMGAIYVENMQNIKNPRVGIVNIGVEREKGNALTKEAHELLAQQTNIHFVGNVEARDLPSDVADVIVCDGFVGNVILKYTEGFGTAILSLVKEELMSSTLSKIGALLASKAFKNIKRRFDYSDVGGAPFLGLKSLVVKAHGSAKARDIVGAINQCSLFIESDIINKIQND